MEIQDAAFASTRPKPNFVPHHLKSRSTNPGLDEQMAHTVATREFLSCASVTRLHKHRLHSSSVVSDMLRPTSLPWSAISLAFENFHPLLFGPNPLVEHDHQRRDQLFSFRTNV